MPQKILPKTSKSSANISDAHDGSKQEHISELRSRAASSILARSGQPFVVVVVVVADVAVVVVVGAVENFIYQFFSNKSFSVIWDSDQC